MGPSTPGAGRARRSWRMALTEELPTSTATTYPPAATTPTLVRAWGTAPTSCPALAAGWGRWSAPECARGAEAAAASGTPPRRPRDGALPQPARLEAETAA